MRYISNALIITRNFERNSCIKIKISRSQRNERDSIPSRQISNRSHAQFPINRPFQSDIYIKPVSMAIKNLSQKERYIREAVIHRPAFEKRLTEQSWGGREGEKKFETRGGTILKSPVSTPVLVKWRRYDTASKKRGEYEDPNKPKAHH